MPGGVLLDRTVALSTEGYRFLPRRRRRHGDVFLSRLLGRRMILLHGPDAARIFYDPRLFERAKAMPRRVQKTLVGRRGVQTLDGSAHEVRKAMFMSVMTPERVEEIENLTASTMVASAARWENQERIILFDEAREIMTKVAFAWAGIPLAEAHAASRARDLGATVDAFGRAGPSHWRGRLARRRAEGWAKKIIREIRRGQIEADPDRAATVVASHRDPSGHLLDQKVAAVELLNILRPISAIDRYIVFAAMALHLHPRERSQLEKSSDRKAIEFFVQEVRRFYPYTPFVGARVKQDFDWRGQHFPTGRMVLLDVYGANHDPGLWDDPERFRPGRFREWRENPYDFIPQGGSDHAGHRCAGEWLTIAAMSAAVAFLSQTIDYRVPDQDLTIDLGSIPTRPSSGFVIENIDERGT